MFKFMIGSKVYYIKDKKVEEGYLYSIEHPILNILHDNNIPVAPRILIDTLFFLIDQVIEFFKKMEGDVNNVLAIIPGQIRHRIPSEFNDAYDFIVNIVDPLLSPIDLRFLGALGLKKVVNMSLMDLFAAMTIQCDIASKGVGDTTIIVQNIPGHRIFATREEAEAHLGGSGLFCPICYKEYTSLKEYLSSGIICDTCKANLANAFNKLYDLFFDYNGVKLMSATISGDKHKKLPSPDADGISPLEKERRTNDIISYINDSMNSDRVVFKDIKPYDAGIFGLKTDVVIKKSIYLKNTKDKNKSPILNINKIDKRIDMTKEVYSNYVNFLRGLFDPNSVELMRDSRNDGVNNNHLKFIIPGFQSYDIDENITEILDMKVDIVDIPEKDISSIESIEFKAYHISPVRTKFNNTTDTNQYINVKKIDKTVMKYRFIKNVENKLFSMENEHIPIAFDILEVGKWVVIGIINYSDRLPVKEYATFDITKKTSANGNNVVFVNKEYENFENKEIHSSDIVKYNEELTIPAGYTVNCIATDGVFEYPLEINQEETLTDYFRDKYNKVKIKYTYSYGNEVDVYLKEFSFVFINDSVLGAEVSCFTSLKTPKLGVNRRYYIDNTPVDLIINLSANMNIEYNRMIYEFFIKTKEGSYKAVSTYEIPLSDKIDYYGVGIKFEEAIKFEPDKLTESGEYLIIPHVEYSYNSDKRFYWFGNDHPESWMKLYLVNSATGAGDYNVNVFVDIGEIFDVIEAHFIKIKPDMEYEENEDKYNGAIFDYFEKYMTEVSENLLDGIDVKGVKNIITGNEIIDNTIISSFDYIIQEDDKTKKLIDLSDIIINNSLINEINKTFEYSYPNLKFSIGDYSFNSNKSKCNIFLEVYYQNASEIKLMVGQDVWHIEPVVKNTPIHFIHRGILTSIGFSESTVKYKYSQIEKHLLGSNTKTNILSYSIPHLTEYLPPKLPNDLLIDRTSDIERTFNTFKEAKKNSMWFFCPICFTVRKPQSDRKAKSFRQIYKLMLDKTDKKAIELVKESKASLSIKKTLDTYIDKSNQYQEAYKNTLLKVKKDTDTVNNSESLLDNQFKTGALNRTDYEANRQKDPNIAGSTTLQDKINSETGLNDTSGKDVVDAELAMYETLKSKETADELPVNLAKYAYSLNETIDKKKNEYIDNKYKKTKEYIVDKRERAERKVYSEVASYLSKKDIDILKLQIIFNDSVLSDSVKICSKCQQRLLDLLTGPIKDIMMYIKDLVTLGYENISFELNEYIDVEYYKDDRKFVKFNYKMPLTKYEKDEIIKKITKLFEDGFQ